MNSMASRMPALPPGLPILLNKRAPLALMCLLLLACPFSFGWGKDGHEIINFVAARSFPSDLPAFMRTAQARREIRYLGPEPDRWRSSSAPELNAAQAMQHFIDLEIALKAAPNGLPDERAEFMRDLYAAQIEHPRMADKFTPQRVGMLPWQADEVYERLEVDMREYRERVAEHEDTHGVEIAILYDTGWLGHYVGDGSEPLHTSINYNGWAEKQNPQNFTRLPGIHWQFESEFVHDNIRANDVLPLVSPNPTELERPFQDFVSYLKDSNSQVTELYQLYKDGGFCGHGSAQGRKFTEERLAAGAAMLRNMVYTAWLKSAEPLPERPHRAPEKISDPCAGVPNQGASVSH